MGGVTSVVGILTAGLIGQSAVNILDKRGNQVVNVVDVRTGQVVDLAAKFTTRGLEIIDSRTGDALRVIEDIGQHVVNVVDARTSQLIATLQGVSITALDIVDKQTHFAIASVSALGTDLLLTVKIGIKLLHLTVLCSVFSLFVLLWYRLVAPNFQLHNDRLFYFSTAALVIVTSIFLYAFWAVSYIGMSSNVTPFPPPHPIAQAPQSMIGDIKYSAQYADHSGWILCDGRPVKKSECDSLFKLLTAAFGNGNGKDTFNIPDLAGKVIASPNNKHHLGKSVGEEEFHLSHGQLPTHAHYLFGSDRSPGSGGCVVEGDQVAGRENGGGGCPSYKIGQHTGGRPQHGRSSEVGSGNAINQMQPTVYAGYAFMFVGDVCFSSCHR